MCLENWRQSKSVVVFKGMELDTRWIFDELWRINISLGKF